MFVSYFVSFVINGAAVGWLSGLLILSGSIIHQKLVRAEFIIIVIIAYAEETVNLSHRHSLVYV